jgi:hypothetical protein
LPTNRSGSSRSAPAGSKDHLRRDGFIASGKPDDFALAIVHLDSDGAFIGLSEPDQGLQEW